MAPHKTPDRHTQPPQLLKWVGNKQKFAKSIIDTFPGDYNRYFEPFLGSGAVLGALSPHKGVASDSLEPLVEIWRMLKNNPQELIDSYDFYRSRINSNETKNIIYREALDRFNKNRKGKDFVFLTRACYGGVIRFRKSDNYMSTPCGVHMPISTESFAKRVMEWSPRVQKTEFLVSDYKNILDAAGDGDLVYCDPPYVDSQKILYGAQDFSFNDLICKITEAKERGALIALSIDGSKKSGSKEIEHNFPEDLFEVEAYISLGSSMLRRLQMKGQKMVEENVKDRLLLTYIPENMK